MTRQTAPAYALALVLLDAAAAWCQDPTTAGSLPCRTQFVRFDVVSGRLTASSNSHGQSRTATTAHSSGTPAETLSTSGPCDKPVVRYQYTDETQDLTIDFACGANVRLVSEPKDKAKQPRVLFEQLVGKDLKLTIENADQSRNYTAPGLWHLVLAEPAACKEHLFPALARLRSDWLFDLRIAELETALFELSNSGAIEQRRKWGTLVDQLGDRSYQVRQAADRELRTMGHAVLPYLSKLDPTRLDAEQRQRLRRITSDLTLGSHDTPERAAAWLLDDKQIWLVLLSHPRPEYRHVAALQLARLCDRTIEFDPAAAEIERKAQIERLRERLASGL